MSEEQNSNLDQRHGKDTMGSSLSCLPDLVEMKTHGVLDLFQRVQNSEERKIEVLAHILNLCKLLSTSDGSS